MALGLERIAPGFLIAAPSLLDPNFDRTVILMCAHSDQGAMGLVINRQAPITTGEIMRQLELDVVGLQQQSALVGGPVSLQNALLLYQPESEFAEREDDLDIGSELRLSPGHDLLEQIARGEGPARYHLFLGHAGWGPGQLETELGQGAWLPADLRTDLIFDIPIDDRWLDALTVEGLDPAMLGSYTPAS